MFRGWGKSKENTPQDVTELNPRNPMHSSTIELRATLSNNSPMRFSDSSLQNSGGDRDLSMRKTVDSTSSSSTSGKVSIKNSVAGEISFDNLLLPKSIIWLQEVVFGRHEPLRMFMLMILITIGYGCFLYKLVQPIGPKYIVPTIIEQAYYFIHYCTSIYNIYFCYSLSRNRWIHSVYERYQEVAPGYIDTTEASNMLYLLSVKIAGYIWIFLSVLTIATLVVTIQMIAQQQKLSGDETNNEQYITLSLVIVSLIIFEIPVIFINLHAMGLWVWLCFMSYRMTNKQFQQISPEYITSHLVLAAFLKALEKQTELSEIWNRNNVVRIINNMMTAFYFVYQMLSSLSTFLSVYNLKLVCEDPITTLDPTPDGSDLSIPTSQPTSAPSTLVFGFCCKFESMFDTAISFSCFNLFLNLLQAAIAFSLIIALVGLPAYIGDRFILKMKKTLHSYFGSESEEVQYAANMTCQVIVLSQASLRIAYTSVDMGKMTLVMTVLGYIITYGGSVAIANISN